MSLRRTALELWREVGGLIGSVVLGIAVAAFLEGWALVTAIVVIFIGVGVYIRVAPPERGLSALSATPRSAARGSRRDRTPR